MIGLAIVPDVLADPRPRVVPPTATLADAVSSLRDGAGACAVADDAGRLVGMLTEHHVMLALAAGREPARTPVAQVMAADPDSLAPSDSPRHAIELMLIRGVTHLPVVADGAVIGVVSQADLLRLANREIERAEERLRASLFGEREGR